ncbi:hypothetical protein [Umboniibacter marinipuniceus]|uniref:Uncharacterized protein n=1 Tax=Umboniibacter marinipuniceus TaxID=569599 RepID=A0A3M0A5C5_9GAMM|nr:hypothetical protein [Umboniibacter marinipuniceus]RMA77665.1 hypothetical protein DFR27_2485 [Umboniibacter marinipuniceus]
MKEDHFVLLTTTLVAGLATASQFLNLDFSAIDTQLVCVVQQSDFGVMLATSAQTVLDSLFSLLRA